MTSAFDKKQFIGQKLDQEELITADQLAVALAIQKKSGENLGKILIHAGVCSGLDFYRLLATHLELSFVNLLESESLNLDLLEAEQIKHYIAHQALPYAQQNGVTLIATTAITEECEAWAKVQFSHYRFSITAPRDIHQTLMRHFSDTLSKESVEALWDKAPLLSARDTVTKKQKRVLISASLYMVGLGVLFPLYTFIALLCILNLFCFATLIFKAIIFFNGYFKRESLWQKRTHVNEHDSNLPLYTILVPMYKEVASLPRLIASIRALDYPKSKLDVKLVLEADDTATITAAKDLAPEGYFEIITVPPSYPRTKPKACNYALRFSRGEFVTIYDAEDRPDPQQLRKVVATFRKNDSRLICVQCRLNY